MRYREVTDWIGLGASLVVHASLALWLCEYELKLGIHLPPLPMSRAGMEEMLVPFEFFGSRESEFGEAGGKGTATDSSMGQELMMAREGDQDQPWLSRDPVGAGLTLPDEPSKSLVPPGDGGAGGKPGMPGAPPALLAGAQSPPGPVGVRAMPGGPPIIVVRLPKRLEKPSLPPEMDMTGLATAATQPVEADAKDQRTVKGTTRPVEEGAAPETMPSRPMVVAAAVMPSQPGPKETPAKEDVRNAGKTLTPTLSQREREQQTLTPTLSQRERGQEAAGDGGGGRPGPRVAPADAAPMAETESDPFARIGSISFRPGRVDARLGRGHKLIKPRLSTKAGLDIVTLQNPTVLLKIAIDETGKVMDVEILKSSGSNEIDLPTRLAMYKSWFEPRKDANGKDASDIILLQIKYY